MPAFRVPPLSIVGCLTGGLAGVPPRTGQVNVPLAMACDLEAGPVVSGRACFEVPALLAQVGALP